MLTDSEATSALGKRHHSSDEETSSPAGSGHNIHPKNRRKVDDGKQVMDAVEAEHASSQTTAPSGTTPLYPSITSTTPSEISENVKSPMESPRAILPLAVPGEDSLLQLDQLDRHPSTEDVRLTNPARDRVKFQSEEPMISHPNSASELYERLTENLPPGHSNAISAWFHALSLPYWPERVKIDRESKKGRNALDDTESVSGLPPSSQHNMANAGRGVGKEEHYTACTLNQSTLTKYCNWHFTHAIPPENMYPTSAKDTYAEEYRCPKSGEARFIHNVEDRPKRGLDAAGNPEPINRLIVNHLLKEVARMNAVTQFVLPEEWKEEPETPPLSYNPPDPDPYVSHLPQAKRFLARVPIEQELYPTVKEESPPLEGFSPESQQEESPESRAARNEIEALCGDYIIDESPDANTEQNKSIAIDFYTKFNLMSLPSDKLQARADVVRALQRIGGEIPCFRMKSREYIKEKNLIRCFGDVTDSEETDSIHEYPPTIINAFLVYKSTMRAEPSEGKIEATVGNLLQSIVAGKEIFSFRNSALVFPPNLRPVGSSPRPDLYVRAKEDFGWPKSLEALLPMVFAGEGKRDSTVDVEDIRAQLATAFHATLIILILYYLDTRKELTSDLPPWLFLYGIEYTEYGVNICAHFPSYEIDGGSGRWCLESKIITQDYRAVFLTSNKPQRMRFLSNLYRIRFHSVFVLQQLRDWTRAEKVLGVLLKGA